MNPTKRTNTRKDFSQVALSVVQQAAGEVTAPAPSKKPVSGRMTRANKTPAKPAKSE